MRAVLVRPSDVVVWPLNPRTLGLATFRLTVTGVLVLSTGSYAVSLWYRVADRTDETSPVYVSSLLNAELLASRTSLLQW